MIRTISIIQKIKVGGIFLIGFFICLSCQDGFENEYAEQIVLNCLFCPTDTLRVNTTWAMSLSEESLLPVNGADISFTNDGENYYSLVPENVIALPSLPIYFTREGYYYLPQLIVRQGNICSMNLTYEDHKLSANDIVPDIVPIDSLQYIDSIYDNYRIFWL